MFIRNKVAIATALKGKKRFELLFDDPQKYSAPGLSLLVKATGDSDCLFAVCAGKRAGNAVYRNRLKRITRVALEPFSSSLPPGYYLAFFPDKSFNNQSAPERIQTMQQLLGRAGLA